MADRKTTNKKTNNPKEEDHYHFWDLPKNIFPRNKGNKSKSYAQDISRLYQGLSYTNKKLQESGQIAMFHIKSITLAKGYNTSPEEVFPAIEDFVYNYENFCFRVYNLREKILQFINAVLPVGYKDDRVSISHMLINPIIKDSKILGEIENFNKKMSLGKIISDRKFLTHRLYYTDIDHYLRPKIQESKKDIWFKDWAKEIKSRAQMANSAMVDLGRINHNISEKVVKYRRARDTSL